MTGSFRLAVVVYALTVFAGCITLSVRARPRGPILTASMFCLEIATVAQAALDGVQLQRGGTHPELATHVGYLIASVAVLPVAAAGIGLDTGRWGNAGLAVGCFVVAIVSIRLQQTLGAFDA